MSGKAGSGVIEARPDELHFGWMNLNVAALFREQRGDDWCVVPMHDSAYVKHLEGVDGAYDDFVKAYMGAGVSQTTLAERRDRFRTTLAGVRASGRVERPINVYRSATGRLLVHDGHHRAAIACFLGLASPPRNVMGPRYYLAHVARIPALVYGSGHARDGKP